MARNSKVAKKMPSRKPRASEVKGRPRRGRPKVCRFCSERAVWVDYKDVNLLGRFINDRGRIKSRGSTGTCAQHQRDVAVAIKTARELALLQYAVRTRAADPADRRGSGRRGLDSPLRSPDTNVPQPAGSDEHSMAGDGLEGEPVDEAVAPPATGVASDGQRLVETATIAPIS